MFDPHEWAEESYYENLASAQKRAYEKREKAKADRAKVAWRVCPIPSVLHWCTLLQVEFVSGTRQPSATDHTSSSSSSSAAAAASQGREMAALQNASVTRCLVLCFSAEKKRRTKWDVPSSGGGSHSSSPTHSKEPTTTASSSGGGGGIGAQALLNANLINKEMMKLLKKK